MAVTKREYIFSTFVLSVISLALIIGAISSQNWVEGEATLNGKISTVNYGLFQGTTVLAVLESTTLYKIYVTCLMDKNVCALSCRTTAEARQREVEYMLDGVPVNQICNSQVNNSTVLFSDTVEWMNAGIYVTTILFLSLGLLLAAVSAMFGVYNSARSPIEPIAGVFGLYIWNGCGVSVNLLILIIWGAHYAANISKNLCFTFFMYSNSTDITSKLGYSYWLIFVSMFCHIISGVLLSIRYWLISREPPPPVINIDNTKDNSLFLY